MQQDMKISSHRGVISALFTAYFEQGGSGTWILNQGWGGGVLPKAKKKKWPPPIWWWKWSAMQLLQLWMSLRCVLVRMHTLWTAMLNSSEGVPCMTNGVQSWWSKPCTTTVHLDTPYTPHTAPSPVAQHTSCFLWVSLSLSLCWPICNQLQL